VRQRRSKADRFVRHRHAYYNRYGLPMMLTETSIEVRINRESGLRKPSKIAAACAKKASRCWATSVADDRQVDWDAR